MWVQDLNTLKDKLIQVLHSTKQATFCFYIKWFDIDIYLYVQWVVSNLGVSIIVKFTKSAIF